VGEMRSRAGRFVRLALAVPHVAAPAPAAGLSVRARRAARTNRVPSRAAALQSNGTAAEEAGGTAAAVSRAGQPSGVASMGRSLARRACCSRPPFAAARRSPCLLLPGGRQFPVRKPPFYSGPRERTRQGVHRDTRRRVTNRTAPTQLQDVNLPPDLTARKVRSVHIDVCITAANGCQHTSQITRRDTLRNYRIAAGGRQRAYIGVTRR
jgi:hypothetical protein